MREKLIFESLAKEAKVIYPDLNEFEVFETIKTDFQSNRYRTGFQFEME